MSETPRPPHAVLIRSPEKFAPTVVAAVLGRRAKAPALDFVAASRRAWGVAAESLPAEEAGSLAADLTAAGLPALAAPMSLIESLPPPTLVDKAELTGDGFDVASTRDGSAHERLVWTRLAVLCAAGLEERATFKVAESGPALGEQAVRLGLTLATGLPLMKGKPKVERVVESRDRNLVLDLLFLEPARRLRVESRSFDYSLLGSKMGYAAELNFVALVAELVERAPRALRGKGTRALLAKRPASESLYESLDDLGREERWLLTLAALRAVC